MIIPITVFFRLETLCAEFPIFVFDLLGLELSCLSRDL